MAQKKRLEIALAVADYAYVFNYGRIETEGEFSQGARDGECAQGVPLYPNTVLHTISPPDGLLTVRTAVDAPVRRSRS